MVAKSRKFRVYRVFEGKEDGCFISTSVGGKIKIKFRLALTSNALLVSLIKVS